MKVKEERSSVTNARQSRPDLRDPAIHDSLDRYWLSTVRLTLLLLAVWAAAGIGAGIIFADALNQYRFPGTGYPLGFWFAQQGSIIVFIFLILVYCLVMNRLDRRHRQELEMLQAEKEVEK